jgi:hypothetical protein
VIGADYNYRNTNFLGGKSLFGNAWIQSSFSDPDTGPGADPLAIEGNGLAFGARLEYPNDRTRWSLSAAVLEDEFNPALGFSNRVGIRDFRGTFHRRWRPSSDLFETVETKIEGRLVTGFSPTVETGEFAWTVLHVTSPIGDSLRLQYVHQYEFVQTAEAFSSFSVPVGRFHFDEGRIRIRMSKNRWIGGEVLIGAGSFFDGTRTRLRADLSFRFSKFVQMGIVYGVNDIRLPDGDELIHLLSTRFSFLFTPELSWITLVQFDNVSDSIAINSRFRWIIEDGRELFLVVNQGLDTSDGVRAGRTAPLVKLQWTLRF